MVVFVFFMFLVLLMFFVMAVMWIAMSKLYPCSQVVRVCIEPQEHAASSAIIAMHTIATV